VALKMILGGSHAGADELQRFRREAEALASLQHPHIVQIYEIGEANLGTGARCPYFSLEFCPEGSLSGRLRGKPLPPREAARLVAVLAEAIHTAHEHGIVHRDLKPGNVLLAHPAALTVIAAEEEAAPLAGLVPKVTDFGLAKRFETGEGQTASGAVLGTPGY